MLDITLGEGDTEPNMVQSLFSCIYFNGGAGRGKENTFVRKYQSWKEMNKRRKKVTGGWGAI